MSARSLVALLACSALLLTGGPAVAGDTPSEVEVRRVVEREVTDSATFTGRIEAATRVDLRARVTGYLEKVNFKDGDEVKKDQVLFEIDARLYQAQVALADANLVLKEAHLRRAQKDVERLEVLLPKGAVSKEEYEQGLAARDEAKAALAAARAARDVARLNLDFTKVVAPVSGRIGRLRTDPGNLVVADETLLATVVGKEPMQVGFDVDERTYLQLRRGLLRDGKGKKEAELPVRLGLSDEEDYPREGKVVFVDNQLDPKQGTIAMRAVIPNPDGLLSPGLFVGVRMTTSEPYKVLLIPKPNLSVRFDKGGEGVFVVNSKNVIEAREVTFGPKRDGLVVVKQGLKAGDRVVIYGGSGLRVGTVVKPVEAPEPAPPKKPRQ